MGGEESGVAAEGATARMRPDGGLCGWGGGSGRVAPSAPDGEEQGVAGVVERVGGLGVADGVGDGVERVVRATGSLLVGFTPSLQAHLSLDKTPSGVDQAVVGMLSSGPARDRSQWRRLCLVQAQPGDHRHRHGRPRTGRPDYYGHGAAQTDRESIRTEVRALRAEARADRADAQADRDAIRAENHADREAFEQHITRLTQGQSRLSGIVEQTRTAER